MTDKLLIEGNKEIMERMSWILNKDQLKGCKARLVIGLLTYAYDVMLLYCQSLLYLMEKYVASYVAGYVNQIVELVILRYARDACFSYDAWSCWWDYDICWLAFVAICVLWLSLDVVMQGKGKGKHMMQGKGKCIRQR